MTPARFLKLMAVPFVLASFGFFGVWCYDVWWELTRRTHGSTILAAVVAADPEAIDPAQEGKLVLVHGRIRPLAPLADTTLNVTFDAISVRRAVATWAWTETRREQWDSNPDPKRRRKTETATYQKEWTESFRSSSAFLESRGHENPTTTWITSDVLLAPAARLGGRQLTRMPGFFGSTWKDRPAPPEVLARLPARLAGKARVVDGKLCFSADPATLTLGDQRVRWEVVAAQPVTLLMAQRGRELVPWTAPWGQAIAEIEAGEIDLAGFRRNSHFGNLWFAPRPMVQAANPGLLIVGLVLLLPAMLLTGRAKRIQRMQAAAATVTPAP